MNPDLYPAPKFTRGNAVIVLLGVHAGQTGSIIAVSSNQHAFWSKRTYRVLIDQAVNGAHYSFPFRERDLKLVDVVTRLAALAS